VVWLAPEHCPHAAVLLMTLQIGNSGLVQPFAGAPASVAPGRTHVAHVSNVVSPGVRSHMPAEHEGFAASHWTHLSKFGLPAAVSHADVAPTHAEVAPAAHCTHVLTLGLPFVVSQAVLGAVQRLVSFELHWTQVSKAESSGSTSQISVVPQAAALAESHSAHVEKFGSLTTSSQTSGCAHP
jgi:hypothetical protein